MAASITATYLYPEAARNRWQIRNLRMCDKIFLLVSKALTA